MRHTPNHLKYQTAQNPVQVISDFNKPLDDTSKKSIDSLPKSRLTGKPVLHFVHANGFVGECYMSLFEIWSQYFTVVAIMRFGTHSDYAIDDNWHSLTWQVADSIDKTCQIHGVASLVAVGHSVGAMTSLQAYYKNSAKISQIIALDPPLLMGRTAVLWHLAKYIDRQNNNHTIMDRISPSGKSKHRRDVFDNRQHAYDNFKDKQLFKRFDERAFLAYINHGMCHQKNNINANNADTQLVDVNNSNQADIHFDDTPVTLTIGKDKEVAIFRTIPTWSWYHKPKTKAGITLIVGDDSHFTKMGSYTGASTVLGLTVLYHKGTHMFALEYPQSVATLVLDVIAQNIS